MAALVWDQSGQRSYEIGVDRGVLYVMQANGSYGTGVAWNGLTAITESPSGAEDTTLWADNIKYLTLKSAEEFGLTLECYTYPDEWLECDGSVSITTGVTIGQQPRKKFGLCYRTRVGTDAKNHEENGQYKLHLVYGCSATPSEKAYSTVNDSPDAITFSYEISCIPANATGYKPTAIITIDASKVTASKLETLEGMLYGGDSASPTLPDPDTVIATLS